MTINPRDIIEQAKQVEAQRDSAKAQLDLAKANLDRYERLYSEDAIAKSILDQYRTNYESAEAQYNAAVAVEATSHNSLSYTYLTAETDGIISAINVESGQVVSAGQVVCTLVQTGELEISINVPENRLNEVTIGSTVSINFWAIDGKYSGVVREVSPMADAYTRTFTVKITILDPPENLQLGMTASVQTYSEDFSTDVEIPLSAILQTDDHPQVWIVENNHVNLKNISIVSIKEKTALVHGISSGSVIVTAGVHKLNDGDSVRLAGDS